MKLEIEVSEQDLIEFGKQAIEKEIRDSLIWLRLRRDFERVSQEIRAHWQVDDYEKEVSAIREEVWQEYKQEIGL